MAKRNNTSHSTTNPASKIFAIIHLNIIPQTFNMSGHIMSTWAMKPSTHQGCNDILGDPSSKNSNCQQHNQMTRITSNGDEILLVIRWQNTTILQILIPTQPWKPWWLSIQTSYHQHTSTHQVILSPHEQLPHSLTKSYEAAHSSRVC